MNNDFVEDIYKTLNILCVEDDEDTLELYETLFCETFHKVYCAKDGVEGFELFEKEKIDIVLTDHNMPRENGLEMSKKIRAIDTSLPIIMITALESIEMLREAIELNITNFLKKPLSSSALFNALNNAVKSVLFDRYLLQEQREKIIYSTYQENLTFAKEKLIAKNDLSTNKEFFNFECDLFYQPLDILSGDSYSIREISATKYLLFIVDGMGKGISASVTAMICSSFINYYIDQIKEEHHAFSLEILIQNFLKYIQPNLLEDEVVSASFFLFDKTKSNIEYAIFSMPPALYTSNKDQEVHKIRSNNTPIASYSHSFNRDFLEFDHIEKLIIYTDGLNECHLSDDELYTNYLKEDFLQAKDCKDFQHLYQNKVPQQDDDITYIFLHKKELQADKN